MGMFSKPERKTLAEAFPPGVPFRLVRAWMVGITRTETGDRMLAKIEAEPVEGGPALEFGVWGSLCDQVRRIEPGELPAIVTLDNTTGLWLFSPHGPLPQVVADPETGQKAEQAMHATPEAHLDLEGGVTEPPAALPPQAAPRGTDIDDSHSEAPAALPPAAAPKGTDLDESQVFDPRGDLPPAA